MKNSPSGSSGSSGRVRGGEKHEIYAAAFGGHLLMTYFHRAGGGGAGPLAPWPPWICYCGIWVFSVWWFGQWLDDSCNPGRNSVYSFTGNSFVHINVVFFLRKFFWQIVGYILQDPAIVFSSVELLNNFMAS